MEKLFNKALKNIYIICFRKDVTKDYLDAIELE